MPHAKRIITLLTSLALCLSVTSVSATSYYEILVKRQRAKEGAELVRKEQPRFIRVGTRKYSNRRADELRRIETKAGEQAKEACILDDKGVNSPGFLTCFKQKRAEITEKMIKESEQSKTSVMDPIQIERAKIQQRARRGL